ncbi:MAG TPA: tripartite tricarboxylate transporter substrate binding protein [Burkholderiales bacterium]|nr:tripartite tricarboxylate transporter substrate binding protein [Burkholderiales bacterium]
MNRRQVLLTGAALALCGPLAAFAQAFPSRPVRLVVPFPPGGPTDIFARAYAARLETALGQPVVVDNKAGASGAIGAAEVARARADGHTLLFGTASTHALYNLIVEKPQYDSIKDFAHVAVVGGAPAVLVAHPSQPETLKAVVDLARAQPAKLRYGSPGTGTFLHVAAERFNRAAGISIQHVPYKGSGQTKPALLGGQVELIVDTLGSSLANHKAGRARILAVAAPKRSPLAPEIPTVDEALGTKGFQAVLWNVVCAPAGTAAPVLVQLSRATAKALSDASLREQLAQLGIDVETDITLGAATAYITAEMGRLKPVVEGLETR